MRLHLALPSTLCLLLLAGLTLRAEDKDDKTKNKTPVAQKLEVKDVQLTRGRPTKPTVIKTEDLTEAFAKNEAAATAVKKAVNFDKQEVLLFSWGGSGQDKLGFKITSEEKDGAVVFEYQPGLTRDLRQHLHVFAIRKGAEWKVEMKPFRRGG